MNDLTMQLPTEIVERAVRDKITAAIARELGDPAELISKQVALALEMKVDTNGKVSRYSGDNKFTFLESNANKLIRDCAKEALVEYFNDNKQAIKDAVKKEVAKSPAKLAKVFMDGITQGMSATWGSTVSINFKNNQEDFD